MQNEPIRVLKIKTKKSKMKLQINELIKIQSDETSCVNTSSCKKIKFITVNFPFLLATVQNIIISMCVFLEEQIFHVHASAFNFISHHWH